MSSKGSQPSGEQTVTNVTQLPDWLDSSLQGASQQAQHLYGTSSIPYYPGETTVPYSPQTLAGLSGAQAIADAGGPQGARQSLETFGGLVSGAGTLGREGVDALGRTSAGDYLYGGEGFDAAYDAAMRNITPTIQSTFEGAGRTGSGLAQEAIGQAAADTFAGLYDRERDRQDAASSSLTDLFSAGQDRTVQGLALAPTMTELAYDPYNRKLSVGGAYEGKTEEELAADMARYGYDSSANERLFDQYLSRITGIAPYGGAVNSQTSPYYSNTGASILGGASTGAGIGQAISGGLSVANPWLAPLGALGGGLLGWGGR